jgi:hypothetical protein
MTCIAYASGKSQNNARLSTDRTRKQFHSFPRHFAKQADENVAKSIATDGFRVCTSMKLPKALATGFSVSMMHFIIIIIYFIIVILCIIACVVVCLSRQGNN